jgi:coenzyme F420-reducing hydrogenase gamma subunit
LGVGRFRRKVQALLPLVALVTILIVALIVGNPSPPAVVHSEPDFDQDCYCHSGQTARIEVNGTDASAFVARVATGETFTLVVRIEFYEPVTTLENVAGWTPDMGDNAKFTFSPSQVVDNSPQDKEPAVGTMIAAFKITAPNMPQSYQLALSVRGSIQSITVNVGEGVAASYAAITSVDYPLASRAGNTVRLNITLQNNGTMPSTFYVYATNGSTNQVISEKVYSGASVDANGTTVLSSTFEMPNSTLSIIVRSGHVQDSVDIDDDRTAVSILQSLSPPPIQTTSLPALAKQWAPWLVIAAASLVSVPLTGSYVRRKKELFSKGERLKLAIVDCAICGGCEVAIADLGEQVLNLLSDRVELVYAPILMSAREFGPVDVVFVVGSIRNEEDLRAVREAREKAKVLVAFGTCPGFGGLNNLSNLYSKEELLDAAYVNASSMDPNGGRTVPNVKVPGLLGEIRPLSDYVKVDVTLPGCPPPAQVIRDALDVLLHGVPSRVEAKKR